MKVPAGKQPLVWALVAPIALASCAAFFSWFATPVPVLAEIPKSQPSQLHDPASIAGQAPPEGHLRVVAWNMEWYPGRGMDPSLYEQDEHEKTAKHELQKIDPDIFLAQEIRSWRDFDQLVSAVPGLQTAVVSSFKVRAEIGKQQMAIATKLPVNSAWNEDWKESPVTPPRGLTVALIEVPDSNKLLLVYSVHLKSNRGNSDGMAESNYRRREESVRQILAHVRDMETLFEGRISGVIVGGDFNTNQDGRLGDTSILMMILDGFYNTWADTPAEARQTWRGSERFRPTTFDYFFTKGISPLRAKIIEAEGSDHRPIEISVPVADLTD
jgi:endonuclease/exonuclease/phosphatase family metal-dependent hydrolase